MANDEEFPVCRWKGSVRVMGVILRPAEVLVDGIQGSAVYVMAYVVTRHNAISVPRARATRMMGLPSFVCFPNHLFFLCSGTHGSTPESRRRRPYWCVPSSRASAKTSKDSQGKEKVRNRQRRTRQPYRSRRTPSQTSSTLVPRREPFRIWCNPRCASNRSKAPRTSGVCVGRGSHMHH